MLWRSFGRRFGAFLSDVGGVLGGRFGAGLGAGLRVWGNRIGQIWEVLGVRFGETFVDFAERFVHPCRKPAGPHKRLTHVAKPKWRPNNFAPVSPPTYVALTLSLTQQPDRAP